MGHNTTPTPDDQPVAPEAEVDPDQLSIGDALGETSATAPEDLAPETADPEPEDVWWADGDVVADDYKVGDTIDLPRAGMVRLPDGTVVTARTHYTARHVGEHAFIAMFDGKAVEAKFEVR